MKKVINMLNEKKQIEKVIHEISMKKQVVFTFFLESKYLKINYLQGLEIVKTELKDFKELPKEFLLKRGIK